jgi:peroxiredoxin
MKRTSWIMTMWLTISAVAAVAPRVHGGNAGEGSPRGSVGKKAADFELPDPAGASHTLVELASKNTLTVVAFIGTECPLSAIYVERLAQLSKDYRDRGVAFVGIDSNPQDSLEAIARYALSHELPFTILKDAGRKVADAFAATRTPEVFLLDSDLTIRYQGRIDDQYGIDSSRPEAIHNFLAIAVDALLAGKSVEQAYVPAVGCRIGRDVRSVDSKAKVSYHRDIAPILRSRCVSCHRKGEIGPFSLDRYETAANWSETIREVVDEGRMPPWDASPKHGSFKNDARLTDAEKAKLLAWIDAGAPEGENGEAPSVPATSTVTPGRSLANPDLVIEMPKEFHIPAHGTVPYQFFVVDPGFKEDKWVRASEARAGNRRVVHHILVFIQPPGERKRSAKGDVGSNWLAAGVPGGPPWILDDGLGRFIPAGSKLVFQLHYTPDGRPETDRSKVSLVFADPKTIRKELRSAVAINSGIEIPPESSDYHNTADYQFDQDMYLYALSPHMHLRGKSFRFEAIFPPDGARSEVLLDVPRYRFNWQNIYLLKEPMFMPERTTIRCSATFDNSAENPSNPDPKARVKFGDQTWEEMLVGYFDVALAEQDLTLGGPRVEPRDDGGASVSFRYKPPVAASKVYLAGDFNEWKPDDLEMRGPDQAGFYTRTIDLSPGKHEYKYVIDGKIWKYDPGVREQEGFYHNSVVTVPAARRR